MVPGAQVLHIPAGPGIDQRTQDELQPPGGSNYMQRNVRYTHDMSLTCRYGFTSYGKLRMDGSSRATAKRVFASERSVCVVDGTTLDVHSFAAGAGVSVGRVPEFGYSVKRVPAMFSDFTGSQLYQMRVKDAAWVSGGSGNGYFGLISVGRQTATNGNVVVSVVDGNAFSVVSPPSKIAGNAYVARMASYGPYLIAIFARTPDIFAFYLDTTSRATIANGWQMISGAALWSDSTVFTDGGTFCVSQISDRVFVAYVDGGGNIKIRSFNVAGAIAGSATVAVTPDSLSIDAVQGGNLWLAYEVGNLVKTRAYSPTTFAATGTELADTLGAVDNGPSEVHVVGTTTNTARVMARYYAWGQAVYGIGSTFSAIKHRSVSVSGGAVVGEVAAAVTIPNAVFASRPVYSGGRLYVALYAGENATAISSGGVISVGSAAENGCYQGQVVVCDVTDRIWSGPSSAPYCRPVVVPTFYTSTYSEEGTSGSTKAPNKIVVAGDGLYLPLNIKFTASSPGAVLVRMAPSNDCWKPVRNNNQTLLTGGMTTYFDGHRVVEVGWLNRPPIPYMLAGGGGLTFTNGVRWVATYEEVDSSGNWHVSGVSTPSAVVKGAGLSMAVYVAPMSISCRHLNNSRSRVVLYATADNGGVAPYYRIAEMPNDTTSPAVQFLNATAGSSGAQLYTTPGVLGAAQDRMAPPGLMHMVCLNGLIVGATGNTVYWFGQPVQGEGAWTTPIFQQQLDGDDEITGLEVMDGSVFAFRRNAIFTASGEVPSDNAMSGGLSAFRKLSVDVGCIESRSIAACSLGIFFQSERGIEILTRAQSVEWIGGAILDTLAQCPVVTSAVVDQVSDCVRFSLTDGGESTGVTVVYSLSSQRWVSVDDVSDASGNAYACARSATIGYLPSIGWRYSWVDVSGNLYVENRGLYVDPGTVWITAGFETHWLKLGLQQEHQWWQGLLLYKRLGAAGLNMNVYYDWSLSSPDVKSWTSADITTYPSQVEFRPAARKQCVRLKVTHTIPTGFAESAFDSPGLVFIGASIDVAAKQGPTRGTPQLSEGARK